MSKPAVPPEATPYLVDAYQREIEVAHHNRDYEAIDFFTEELMALGRESYSWAKPKPKPKRKPHGVRIPDPRPGAPKQTLAKPGAGKNKHTIETFIDEDGELHEDAPVITVP